ncbi:protease modulator HflC [Cohaesibacter gelatinilyticus]|uniref:Protein HflC n=1 Tax=Cohaesibacter gelatinilyticus TaxID=372072 RepID=A0A285NMY2_9HYPH|nr:protease modulator HflC [Cohaesibacter gelatinilyticus]SNZ08991.1 protease FtsH subunit HflC [Cohaesibacter gelatinilyticus]HAT87526.1 protease modulator HflC [Hyphomicrobiales bacterium]
MSGKAIFSLFVAGLVAIGVYMSVFIVYPMEQAVITQFGRIEKAVADAGVYFKIPFIQRVEYLDKRARYLEQSEREVIASDKKRLVIDSFARYKITDPILFKQKAKTLINLEGQLNGFMDSSLRDGAADLDFRDIVRDKRDQLVEAIRDSVNIKTKRLGVELVDYRIRRADLPRENSDAVYRQMQTERQQEANGIRADGEKVARQIRSRADRDATVIIANAKRDSEITRGEGDAERNAIFSAAYGKNASFFEFYRTMQAYERSLAKGDTRLVLSPEGEFFDFFGGAQKQSAPAAQ